MHDKAEKLRRKVSKPGVLESQFVLRINSPDFHSVIDSKFQEMKAWFPACWQLATLLLFLNIIFSPSHLSHFLAFFLLQVFPRSFQGEEEAADMRPEMSV